MSSELHHHYPHHHLNQQQQPQPPHPSPPPLSLSPLDPVLCVTPLQQMLASCSGALLTSLTMTPLDVVKIRLQAQQRSRLHHRCFLYCNGLMDHVCLCVNGGNGGGGGGGASNGTVCNGGRHCNGGAKSPAWHRRPCPGPYRGASDALLRIARVEGAWSLWSGLLPTLVSAVPATMLYFTGYDRLRVRLLTLPCVERWGLHGAVPLAAGALARVGASSVVAPLELVRTRMQAYGSGGGAGGGAGKSRLVATLWRLVRERGVFGLWRGLLPTLLRDVPFSAIYWCGYEHISWRLRAGATSGDDTSGAGGTALSSHWLWWRPPVAMVSFVAGAAAGSLAAVVTLPFDVVKTHWQIELGGGANGSPEVRGVAAALADIYRRHGWAGLFAGLTPRLVKVAPACAIMVTSYEVGKRTFARYNERKAREQSATSRR